MQSYTTRQTIRSFLNSIKQVICATALYPACEAVRKGQLTFTYMGRLFTLTAVSEREYYVTCNGVDAGIRIHDGIAELA